MSLARRGCSDPRPRASYARQPYAPRQTPLDTGTRLRVSSAVMLRVKSSQVAAASFFALLAALGAGACGGSTTSNGSTGDDSGADGSSSDDGSGSSYTGPGTDSTM